MARYRVDTNCCTDGCTDRRTDGRTEPRAGVLVLSTPTRSTRVLNFWYSYCTRTREFQSHSTHTCTRGQVQVLRYWYEYWHKYWYSMVHLWCKGEKHHTFEIKSMTYHKGKVHTFFQFYHNWKITWIAIFIFIFIVVIRPSPVSYSTSG